jgi:triosephosphate isomerase
LQEYKLSNYIFWLNMKHLVIGNWKMNGTLAHASEFAQHLNEKLWQEEMLTQIILSPPTTLINYLKQNLDSKIKLAAQDTAVNKEATGAYTGDISAAMIKDIGCDYVIVGHSERRQYHHETNQIVRQKAEAVYAANMMAIICVGESMAEKESGSTCKVIESQIKESLPVSATPENTIIAYEPIWAIGTGLVATKDEIGMVHNFLNNMLNKERVSFAKRYKLVYGGSIKSSNVAEILAASYVDGLLVGGASLLWKEFWQIIKVVSEHQKIMSLECS